MSLSVESSQHIEIDALELVESCLTEAGWDFQRDEEDETLQCIAASKWGDMGGMFANRMELRRCIFRSPWTSNPLKRAAWQSLNW